MRFKVVREPKQCAHAPPQLNFTKHFLFERLFFQKLLLLENYGGLAQLGERLHGMQEVTGSIPVFSTIQFVLEPDSLRERVRVRFLFIGNSAEGLHRALNEQRQGITMTVVSCLLL